MNLKISDRMIGTGCPNFIIAELSANHLHNIDVALDIVRESAKACVDALKIQTLTPDTMTIDCDNEYFIINSGTPWDGRTLYDLYRETPLPYEWHQAIFDECKKYGLVCFSTPYDVSALDFLDQFNPAAYKIASFEIFDLKLIKEVAKRMKPVIISTGVADIEDIALAVRACQAVGNNQIILLKCTSAYPAPLNEVNLKTMQNMSDTFGTLVGVSDHTLGHEVALASIPLGGCVIEKHVTLSRDMGGPDAKFSLEPNELKELVNLVRNTELILGKVDYKPTTKAQDNIIFSRSLFIVKDIAAGEKVTEEHIRSIRPGYGLKPKYYDDIIGKKATVDLKRGTPCQWGMFSE